MTYNSSLLLEVNFKWQIYHIPRVFFSFFFNIDEHFNVYFLVYNYIYLYMYICVRAKVSVFNHCNTLYVWQHVYSVHCICNLHFWYEEDIYEHCMPDAKFIQFFWISIAWWIQQIYHLGLLIVHAKNVIYHIMYGWWKF